MLSDHNGKKLEVNGRKLDRNSQISENEITHYYINLGGKKCQEFLFQF